MSKKMKTIIVAACCVLAIPVFAQTTVKWLSEQQQFVKKSDSSVQKEVQWTLQDWNADNSSYLAARNEINALHDKSELSKKILLYKGLAKTQPNNALAQYKWAYSTWSTLDKFASAAERYEAMKDPIKAMLNAPFPHTYDYARLLIIYQSQDGLIYAGALHKYADVLASSHPKDNELQFAVAQMLVQLPNPEYIKKYVPILEHLAQESPTDYRYAVALVGYYSSVDAHNLNAKDSVRNKSRKDFIDSMRNALKYANLPGELRKKYTFLVNSE